MMSTGGEGRQAECSRTSYLARRARNPVFLMMTETAGRDDGLPGLVSYSVSSSDGWMEKKVSGPATRDK